MQRRERHLTARVAMVGTPARTLVGHRLVWFGLVFRGVVYFYLELNSLVNRTVPVTNDRIL